MPQQEPPQPSTKEELIARLCAQVDALTTRAQAALMARMPKRARMPPDAARAVGAHANVATGAFYGGLIGTTNIDPRGRRGCGRRGCRGGRHHASGAVAVCATQEARPQTARNRHRTRGRRGRCLGHTPERA